jgi:hypothetical protein
MSKSFFCSDLTKINRYTSDGLAAVLRISAVYGVDCIYCFGLYAVLISCILF